ncbi:hypothetical protein jhhlp_004207 [Lomentospora prolificans]|uniref:ABC transporter domain-containing protein n=1 Tax=Lomentospora prolificans TaxID=41688 RepID=A0A2N3NAY4_9PEZI|nr:hypothetical protein jhhlp_004207 [Lomentospora prolificans]
MEKTPAHNGRPNTSPISSSSSSNRTATLLLSSPLPTSHLPPTIRAVPPTPPAPTAGASINPGYLVGKPSYASIQTVTEPSLPASAAISQKPSYASLASTKGLVGAAAPISGATGSGTGTGTGAARTALTDVPESPRSPSSLKKLGNIFKGPQSPGVSSGGAQSAAGGAGTTQPAASPAPAAKPAPAPVASAAAGGKVNEKAAVKPEKPKKPPTKFDGYKKRFFTFWKLFTFTSTRDRVRLAFTILAAMAAGAIMPMSSIVFGRLVTAATSYNPTTTAASHREQFNKEVRECVLYMLYLFIGKFVLSYCAMLGFRMTSLRISANLRLSYLSTILPQPISLLDALPPGRMTAILTNTANTVQLGIGEKLGSLVTSLSLVVAALAIAFSHSWKLTLVSASGLVVIAVTYACAVPLMIGRMKSVEESDMAAAAVAGEALGSVRMVAACGAEEKMARRYAGWVRESRRRGAGMGKVVAVQQGVVFFTIYATYALTFYFAIKIVLMCTMLIIASVSGLAAPISAAIRSSIAATALFNGIDIPKPDLKGKKDPEVSATGDIVLTNVNFTYPARHDSKVLIMVNLKIPAGKTTAIVGPSGSGKSTIVGLIERWYELDGDWKTNMKTYWFRNGKITCGGVDLKDMDIRWWRSQIGLVQQEPFLFNDTIQKNIEYGLVGTVWEHESEDIKLSLVKKACREAFADEFISRLPDGLQTNVGDSGIKLSGGQRQRLAIARALIRQPKILILDEATSAIDVRSEQIVQEALDRASRGRTTITIAHRLSTVRRADNIVVLAKGKVVQQGTHDQLMAQPGGAYWKLATAQKMNLGDEEGEDGEDKYRWVRSLERVSLAEMLILGDKHKNLDLMESDGTTTSGETKDGVEDYVPKGFFGSFGTLIVEQGRKWPWYMALLFGALVAGGKFKHSQIPSPRSTGNTNHATSTIACTPIQAFLFAKALSGFYLWGEALRRHVNFWCTMFTALAGAVGIGYFILGGSATALAFKITATYRKEYFKNIISKPISFFDDEANTPGALTALIATDPTQLQQLLGTNMGFALISVLAVTGCIILSFCFGWKLALAALGGSLPLVLAAGFFRIRYESNFDRSNKTVFGESARFSTEAIGAARTVTAFTMEEGILDKYEGLLNAHLDKAWKRAKYSTLVFAASDGMPLLCMAFMLWYGGKLLAEGEYTTFQYLVVYIAVVQGGMAAGQWLSFAPNIAQATAAANRILASRYPGQAHDGKSARDDEADDKAFEAGEGGESQRGASIEFSNVWFRYPTREAPVLNGLNLTIKEGQFAAIVGASGTGKTSIISLLERFYTVNAGAIYLNNTDISTLPASTYRRHISLVAQESALFSGTIRENILAGIPDPSSVSDAALHKVCASVEMHDFIISLPEGYETRVGNKGILLSGGQRQRIAIARALVREPRLLLLDEATASLDSEVERAIQKVFERMKGARTMVVVAHRLATVQNADVIFVLGDGVVLEKGTHAELLAKRGAYHRMCIAQALDR